MDWAKEAMVIGSGESITLEHVSHVDVPASWWKDRKYRTFPGCGNQAIEVSDEEWDMLLALNQQREKEAEAKKRQEEIQGLQEYIAKAEKQKSIPTPEEAKCLRKQWNDIYNLNISRSSRRIFDFLNAASGGPFFHCFFSCKHSGTAI